MQVIVHAEDRSGRGDGYYTKPDIDSALDIFFESVSDPVYADRDGESLLTKEDAAAIFADENAVTFYNEDGEQVTISRDWTPSKSGVKI
jgi:hypothetical protein